MLGVRFSRKTERPPFFDSEFHPFPGPADLRKWQVQWKPPVNVRPTSEGSSSDPCLMAKLNHIQSGPSLRYTCNTDLHLPKHD